MRNRLSVFLLLCSSLIIVSIAYASDASFKEQIKDFKKEARITSPSDKGNGPGFPLQVKGNASDVPDGHHLWVVVHPVKSSGYWPQGGELYPSPRDNSWEVTTYLGEEKKGFGEKFEIILSIANENAHKEFVQYLADGPSKGYPEKPLPSGVIQIDRITYTRTE